MPSYQKLICASLTILIVASSAMSAGVLAQNGKPPAKQEKECPGPGCPAATGGESAPATVSAAAAACGPYGCPGGKSIFIDPIAPEFVAVGLVFAAAGVPAISAFFFIVGLVLESAARQPNAGASPITSPAQSSPPE